MSSIDQTFIAVESKAGIQKAVRNWKTILSSGATKQKRFGGIALTDSERGFWSHFGRTSVNTPLGWRYWNVFGKAPLSATSEKLVEINPQMSGPAKGTQGLVARSPTGDSWILHAGRLHPGSVRIDADMFAKASALDFVEVRFSDQTIHRYFPVANLGEGASVVRYQTSSFVHKCEQVRLFYEFGHSEAQVEEAIHDAEAGLFPEKTGSFHIAARGSSIGDRVHGAVWKALAAELVARCVKHTNARVGSYGPDLRTVGKNPILFEIKTDCNPRSVYEAVGQLCLYEKIIGKSYSKVIVLPSGIRQPLATAVTANGIKVSSYRKVGKVYKFDNLI